MHSVYQIVLENEYDHTIKRFTRVYPNKIGHLEINLTEVFVLIWAEFNKPLESRQLPIYNVTIEKINWHEFPQGHWYRDQFTNNTTQTR